MKKRLLITLLFSALLATVFIGCGKEVAEETVATERVTTEASTEVSAEMQVDLSEKTSETVVETEGTAVPEILLDDSRIEIGMQKINRLIEAYDAIIENYLELNTFIQNDIEKLEMNSASLEYYYFADGAEITKNTTIYAIGIEYYNNYVNNNGEHYNMAIWMSNQPSEESVRSKYFTEELGGSYDTNNKLLMEAIAVANYLKNCESVEGLGVIETAEYIVNDVKSAYAIPLNCDGDTSLTAVFDKDNNLLQIWTPDGWDGYMFTFE